MKGRRHNATGRSTGSGRYVALSHWLMRTAAWRDLNCVARCAYIELAMRVANEKIAAVPLIEASLARSRRLAKCPVQSLRLIHGPRRTCRPAHVAGGVAEERRVNRRRKRRADANRTPFEPQLTFNSLAECAYCCSGTSVRGH